MATVIWNSNRVQQTFAEGPDIVFTFFKISPYDIRARDNCRSQDKTLPPIQYESAPIPLVSIGALSLDSG